MTPLQAHDYILSVLHDCPVDTCERLPDAIALLETYLTMLKDTLQHPRMLKHEDWWGELHRRFYGHRRWPQEGE